MITQPATSGTSILSRPTRLLALGKVVGLVVAIGTVMALAVAGGIGLAALVLSNSTG